MNPTTKTTLKWIGIGIVAIVILNAATFIPGLILQSKFKSLLGEQHEVTEHQFELLAENVAQSETHFQASQRDMQKILRGVLDNFDVVHARLEELDIEPTIINTTSGTVQGETVVIVVEGLDQIPREFIFETEDGMPVAYYLIEEDEVTGEVAMSTGTYDLTVSLNTVIGVDNTLSPEVIVEATIASSGDLTEETYPIPIDNSVSYFTDPDPTVFDWWDPHLDLGGIAQVSIPDPQIGGAATLGVSIMSYGSREEEIIRVIRLGGTWGGDGPGLTASPIMYNIGNTIPLLSDTWIGPSVTYEFDDTPWNVGVAITSTL